MRIVVLVLLLLLLILPAGLAADPVAVADPAQDEALLADAAPGVGPAVCHDAGVDLREVSVTESQDSVTFSMRVADLSVARITCGGVGSLLVSDAVGDAIYTVTARGDCGVTTCATSLSMGFDTFSGDARTTATLGGAAMAGAIGSFSIDGDVLSWTIPLRGTFVDTSGAAHAYDLSGHVVSVFAQNDASATDSLDLVNVEDALDASFDAAL